MNVEELTAFRAAGGQAVFADDYPIPSKRGQILDEDDWEDLLMAAHVRQLLEESMPALVALAGGRSDADAE